MLYASEIDVFVGDTIVFEAVGDFFVEVLYAS